MSRKNQTVEQSPDEVKTHLRQHVNFVRKSSKDFDNGEIEEAKRIATSVRVLLHDTSSSDSILKLLGEKEKVQFLDFSLTIRQGNLMPHIGLVFVNIVNDSKGFRAEYKPHLDSRPENWKSFDEWWEGIVSRVIVFQDRT